jgi:hypothetical protein
MLITAMATKRINKGDKHFLDAILGLLQPAALQDVPHHN